MSPPILTRTSTIVPTPKLFRSEAARSDATGRSHDSGELIVARLHPSHLVRDGDQRAAAVLTRIEGRFDALRIALQHLGQHGGVDLERAVAVGRDADLGQSRRPAFGP